MENIFLKELEKHTLRYKDVCEMLDNYEKNGVKNDEVKLFNLLCKEEMELRFRIDSLNALAENRPANINTAPIMRELRIIQEPPKIVIIDESIKNIKE